ncbi:hypothetical protein TI05_10485 [Achromatium sp. WMS3]|nr:hypothetical protein TI05_10485 [Achromatium sp. WMS3]
MVITRKEIITIFLLSIFTIHISFIPIAAETQPILPLGISLVVLFFLNKFYVQNRVSKDILYSWLLVAILSIYFIIGKFGFGDGSIITYIKYIIGPLIYIAIRKSILNINYKYIIGIVGAFFTLYLLLQFDIFQNIHALLISRSYNTFEIGRMSLLTPEPSYFAHFLILILIYIDLSYKNKIISLKKYNLLRIIMLFIALNVKSDLVFCIVLLYFLSYYPSLKLNKKIFLLFIIGIILVAIINLDFGRLSLILNTIWLLVVGNISLVDVFFIYETSGSTRIIVNYLALANIFDNPMGSGLGSFLETLQNAGTVFGNDLTSHEVLKSKTTDEAQTYFVNLVNDIGVFAFLMLLIVFSNNKKASTGNEQRIKYFIWLSLIVLLLFQCQVSNPIPWILIAILKDLK